MPWDGDGVLLLPPLLVKVSLDRPRMARRMNGEPSLGADEEA